MSENEQGASDAIYREHLKAADERVELEQLRTERAAAVEFTEQLIVNLGSWDILPGGTYEPEFRRRMLQVALGGSVREAAQFAYLSTHPTAVRLLEVLEADGWSEQSLGYLLKIVRREVEK